MADKLTPKQELFVNEYLIDLNATQAAIRAGYSEKTAHSSGPRLLENVGVAAAISARLGKITEKLEVTQERVIAELAKIGFSDIRKAVKWGAGIPVKHPVTGDQVISNGVALLSSDELDDETAGAIAELSETTAGIKIKLYDKRAALVDLGKHLGMFKDTTVLEAGESLKELLRGVDGSSIGPPGRREG